MTAARFVPRWLIVVPLATASVLGLLAELAAYGLGWKKRWVVFFFSLSVEGNLPTWCASTLLFCCSLALFAVAFDLPKKARFRLRWFILAGGFAFMSLDEAVQIHEHAHRLVDPWLKTGGLLFFSWVIPAFALLVVLAGAYFTFLRSLDARSRRWFIISGAIYVGGAVFMDLPLGWWTASHGPDNLGYGLIDWVEESLELAGAGLFLWAVLDHRARQGGAAAPPAIPPATDAAPEEDPA